MKTAERVVKEKKRVIITVPPNTIIIDVIKIMIEANVGSVFIKEDDTIVGRWTERNLLKNCIETGFDLHTSRIGDYMDKRLVTAPHDVSVFHLMDICLKENTRRVLIDKEGEFIGMVYVLDIFEEILDEKNRQLKELNSLINLEYYKR